MSTPRRTAATAGRLLPARSAREAAIAVLSRVDAGEAFANVLLYHVLDQAQLSAVDAGLATELVLGTLRHRARVDWTLQGALRYPLEELPPRIRAILRTAVYQLLFLPRIPPRAAVHESVDLARRHGHPGTVKLVNAVLRRIAADGERALPDTSDPAARLEAEHSHPRWLVSRWMARYGVDGATALCRTNNEPAPIMARVNTLKISPQDAADRLTTAGIGVEPTALAEGLRLSGDFNQRHRLVTEGILSVQDLGAMLVTYILDPQPGETVLDACAAPGGKTAHIAERMRNFGRVIACDIHPDKLQRVSRRAAEEGIDIIEAHHQDARGLGAAFPNVADRLLIDAPCTGLGVLRRRPDIKWRVLPSDLPALAALQRAILRGAGAAVRPGGVLVYSVCTTEPEEGEQVVDQFLREHPEFALDATMPLPPSIGAGGVPGTAILLPHRDGTDGFFIARLRRKGSDQR